MRFTQKWQGNEGALEVAAAAREMSHILDQATMEEKNVKTRRPRVTFAVILLHRLRVLH